MVWKSATDSISANFRVTYTRGATEGDLVLLQRPKPPSFYGLSPSTRLEVWHEWSAPDPVETTTPIKPEAEFWDSFLDFGGGIIFPRGRAFATADEPPRPAGTPAKVELANPRAPGYIPVGKQWFRMTNSSTSVLVEGVLWQDIEPLLSSLPEMAQGSSSPAGKDRVLCLNETLGARRAPPPASAEDKILLARSSYAPKGVVLDWDQVTGGTSYEFGYSSGPPHTYEIAQTVWFSGGTLKFWPNAVLKYVPNTSMHFDGNESIVCNGDISNRTVLTSRDDDLYGEVLPDSSHVPSQNGYIIPLWGQPAPSGTVFLGLTFRWIYIGIDVDDISSGSCTVKRCDFNFCGSAINMEHYAQATVLGSACCHVDVPIDPNGGGTVTGSFVLLSCSSGRTSPASVLRTFPG